MAGFGLQTALRLRMIKSIGKLFARAFGKPTAEGQTFHPSQTCAECVTPLMRTTERAEWHCPNLDCPAQLRARIEHWCSPGALDIAGGEAAFVALLVSRGLARDAAELYRLRLAELTALPGMDKDSAQKFFDALTASQKREGWRTLFGLCIPHLGEAEAKSLCGHFKSVDNVFAASVERLRQAGGVSEAAARSLVQWHGDSVNRKLVKRLFKAGVNFKA